MHMMLAGLLTLLLTRESIDLRTRGCFHTWSGESEMGFGFMDCCSVSELFTLIKVCVSHWVVIVHATDFVVSAETKI